MKKQILTLSAAAFMAALTCQTAFALYHDVGSSTPTIPIAASRKTWATPDLSGMKTR